MYSLALQKITGICTGLYAITDICTGLDAKIIRAGKTHKFKAKLDNSRYGDNVGYAQILNTTPGYGQNFLQLYLNSFSMFVRKHTAKANTFIMDHSSKQAKAR